jgi:pimeloyl-ACP methyl ester carboxylesterase
MRRRLRRVLIIGGGLAVAALLSALGWLWTPDRPRALLESRYLQAPGEYLQVTGVRLHLRDTGPRDAPAIIFLHGFGSSLQTWEAWSAVLATQYRVIRIDLPGFALTGPDPTGDYSDERSVRILTALLDRLGLARASVVGHSIGGRIAWKFAALEPSRVAKLVLISPDGFASPGYAYGKAPAIPPLVRLMRYALPKVLVRMSLAPAFCDPGVLTDKLVDRYYDLMLAPGVRGAMLERMQQTVLEDPEPLLRRIQAPTLLLWGQRDGMIPFTNSADYLRSLPNAVLVPLPATGHVPQEEAPALALPPLEAFLRG